jgi:hypothetical protein
MSILSVNENHCGYYSIWRAKVGKYFPMRMWKEEKVPRKRFGDGDRILTPTAEILFPNTLLK